MRGDLKLHLPGGLKWRLMGAFALLAVGPTLFLGTLAIRNARRDVQLEVIRGNLALIRAIGRGLNATLQDTRRALSVSASAWAQDPTPSRGKNILRSLRSEFAILKQVTFFNANGEHLVGDILSAGEDFSLELANTYGGLVSDVQGEGTNQHVLMTVQARGRTGELAGFLAAMVELSFVQQTLGEARLGNGAALLVIDGNGRKVAARGDLPALDWGPLARPENPILDNVLATYSEGYLEVADKDNRWWVAAYRNIVGMSEFRGVRWGVMLLQPTANAYALARKAIRDTVVVSLLVLGMALIVGAWLASRITRPLALLMRQTDLVAQECLQSTTEQGGFLRSASKQEMCLEQNQNSPFALEKDLPISRNDEIGVLAKSFSTMIQRLRQSRESLDALREFLENLVRSIPVGVISVDRHSTIRSINPAQERLSEVTASSVIGKKIQQVFSSEERDYPVLQTLDQVLRGGAPVDVVLDNRRTPFTQKACLRYRIRIAPLFDQQCHVDGAVILQEDLSERARLEIQLLRSEKLSSVGVLAAGVAHEVNNPLTSILGYAKLLLEERPADDPDRPALELVAEEAQRVQEIVRNLLDYSRKETGERNLYQLNEIVERTLNLAAPDLRKRSITVERQLADKLPSLWIDARQIEQVFVNIITNAAHAMTGGGTLTVRTGHDMQQPERVFAEFNDTGIGIEKKHIPRIFDPFFTTKEPGQGTGLGLAICQRIMTDHGGEIEVHSKKDRGTLFKVWFPLQTGESRD